MSLYQLISLWAASVNNRYLLIDRRFLTKNTGYCFFLLLVAVETHQFSKITGLKGATNELIAKFFALKKSTESNPILIR